MARNSDSRDSSKAQGEAGARKYDRQLRIWGAHGQAALEAARVCMLGSGPTATEALKNLVLGGIAGFTLVDDARVGPRDLGNNFMLDASSLGQASPSHVCCTFRSWCVCKYEPCPVGEGPSRALLFLW